MKYEMAAVIQGLENLPPYTLMQWDVFKNNPCLMYNLFHKYRDGAKDRYYTEEVMDMCSFGHDEKNRQIEVNSVEDLDAITTKMLTKPILFSTRVEISRRDYYNGYIIRGEFAVLVNTRHAAIREKLSMILTQTMAVMQEGHEFCLKLSFGPTVREWFGGVLGGSTDCCPTQTSGTAEDGFASDSMVVSITNTSLPMNICLDPVYVVSCFPCWLLCGGPCYCIRRRNVKDFDHAFSGHQVSMITRSGRVLYHFLPQELYPTLGPSSPITAQPAIAQQSYGYDQPSYQPSAYPGPQQNMTRM